jgi:hypothetical protein
MDQKIEHLREQNRNRLIGLALEHLQLEGIASATIPIPGGDRVIAIGTPAQVARLLPEVRDQVLEEAAEALDIMNDASGDAATYDQREMYEHELEREHAISHCAHAVRALKRAAAVDLADSEGGYHD